MGCKREATVQVLATAQAWSRIGQPSRRLSRTRSASAPFGGWAASGHFGDQLDLDAGAERYLRHTERAAGVGSAVAEDLDQQLRGPVGDQMLLGEGRRAVDQHHELDDPRDSVEVADGGVQGAHELDGDRPRRRLPLAGRQPGAELPDPRLAFLPGDVPRHVDEAPRAHEGDVDGPGPSQLGERDAEGLQLLVGGHSIVVIRPSAYDCAIRTQTGRGTLKGCPTGVNRPLAWSMRKTAMLSDSWFAASR